MLTQEELSNLFLAKDKCGRTVLYFAGRTCQIEVVHKLCEWTKKVLTEEELNYFLLDKQMAEPINYNILPHSLASYF
jgi:hypothetical protein